MIDQKKFEPLYRAAKTVQASLGVGLTYAKFGELLQAFATEISISRDRATTSKEKELVDAYQAALDTLKESGVLWKHKVSSAGYDFIPSGRIFVESELLPLIEKYQLQLKTHRTASVWRSIGEDSIQIVWSKAGEQLNRANSAYYAEETVTDSK